MWLKRIKMSGAPRAAPKVYASGPSCYQVLPTTNPAISRMSKKLKLETPISLLNSYTFSSINEATLCT